MFIDSHFHFDHRQPGIEVMMERLHQAYAQGVTRGMLVVATLDEWERAQLLCAQFPWLDVAFGFHPNDNQNICPQSYQKLQVFAQNGTIVAIGEIGLDYFYDHSRLDQKKLFRQQLNLALQNNLPVVLHCREAFADTFELLSEYPTVTKVFHCFSGGVVEAERALALGAYLSFSGTVTFPKNQELQQAFLATPLSRCLVETDSPFLTPVPLRGRVNEPQYVIHTYRFLAQLRGITVEELATTVADNYQRVFHR